MNTTLAAHASFWLGVAALASDFMLGIYPVNAMWIVFGPPLVLGAMVAFAWGRRAPSGHALFARLGLGLACWSLMPVLLVAIWALAAE